MYLIRRTRKLNNSDWEIEEIETCFVNPKTITYIEKSNLNNNNFRGKEIPSVFINFCVQTENYLPLEIVGTVEDFQYIFYADSSLEFEQEYQKKYKEIYLSQFK